MTTTAGNKIFRLLTWFVLIIYIIILTKMIIFKKPLGYIARYFRDHYSWQVVKANARQANLTPFTTISLYLNKSKRIDYSVENLAGNLVGFIPLGILLPVLFVNIRRTWKIIGISFLLSLLFELTQLVTALGSFDVDDLLLNTIGGLLGYCVFLLFQRPRKMTQ